DLKTHQKSWISTRYPQSGNKWRARPGLIVMKFGEQLRSSIIPEYQWYYIDYDGLKKELKISSGPPVDEAEAGPSNASPSPRKSLTQGQKNQWNEDDEQRFVDKLYEELEKVYNKTKVKETEIQRRITVCDREVKTVVDKVNERGLDEQGPSEEEFMVLEEN